MGIITQAVENALDARRRLFQFFDWNARTRHGVPIEETSPALSVEHKHTHEHRGLETNNLATPPSLPPGPSTPADATEEKHSMTNAKALTILGACLLGASLLTALGGLALSRWYGGDEVTAPGTVLQQSQDGSLIQYLEDEGRHLPQGGN